MRSHTKRLWLVALTFTLSMGCGGSTAAEETEGGHHHHHHAGGHGGGHQHASPEELQPLMRDLFARLTELNEALAAEDLARAAASARAIEVACDDAELEELDAELFGPRFLEIDRELHGAAGQLAERAEADDLEGAREGYGAVAGACVSCHAQAPTASEVDLGALVPEGSVPEGSASEGSAPEDSASES